MCAAYGRTPHCPFPPNSAQRSATTSKAIEYGDRIALTVDGRNFKLYKGIELVSSGTIPDELSITGASSILGWKGLKQIMA